MDSLKAIAVGGLFGTAVAGVNYVEGLESMQLLACLGAVWVVAGWSLTKHRGKLRRADAAHQLLFVFLAIAIPPFAIHADLPLGEFRLPLMFLAMGVAVAGIGLGADLREASKENRTAATSGPISHETNR